MSVLTTTPDEVSATTRRSILLLSFATFSSMAAQRICDAMLPELARVFSTSLGQAAQVVSVFAITYGVAQLVYGPLGDRLGKFRIVTFATLGCSVGSVVAVFATSLDMLVFARFLMALGAAALIPLAMAWVGDTVPTNRVQEMLTRTGLGSTLGIVGGQLVGGVLTDALGWRWAFAFIAVLFAVVGLLLYKDLHRQGKELLSEPVLAAQNEHMAESDISPDGAEPTHFVRQALDILNRSWPRVLLSIAVIEGAAGFGVLAIWASHLHDKLDLSLTLAGTVVALFGLGGVLFMVVGRTLIRRFDQPRLVLVGGALVGVGACVLAYAPHWMMAVPASLLAGFGFFMFHNNMQANATEMAPEARGMSVSLFASFLFLGQSLGVVLAASLISRIGSSAVIALGGVVVAVLGVVFAFALQRRARLTVIGN